MEIILNSPSEQQVFELSRQEDFTFDVLINPGDEVSQISLLGRLVHRNDARTLQYCLKYGANVNYKGDGSSPLNEACYVQNAEIAEILLRAGANPDDIDGYNISCLARCFLPENEDETSFERARGIVNLLIEYSANINLRNEDGNNCLQMILDDDESEISDFRLEGLRYLISLGADPNNVNNTGYTMLKNEFLHSDYEEYRKILSIVGLPSTEILSQLYVQTFSERNDYVQRLTIIYNPHIVLDAEMENFIFMAVRIGAFNRFLQLENTRENYATRYALLNSCRNIFLNILTANYIKFIRDIRLYLPRKRAAIRTMFKLREEGQVSVLSNELLYQIFYFL